MHVAICSKRLRLRVIWSRFEWRSALLSFFYQRHQNQSGLPYILFSVTPDFTFGMVDFTNAAAVEWYAQVIQTNMIGYNQVLYFTFTCTVVPPLTRQSGWMADFAEYLPFDSIIASTQSPATVHNLYPQLWSGVNSLATQVCP